MHIKNFQFSFKNHNFEDYLGENALKKNNMARKAQNKKKYGNDIRDGNKKSVNS